MFDNSQKSIRTELRRWVTTITESKHWELWPVRNENRTKNRGHWDIWLEWGKLIKQGGIRKSAYG